MIGLQNDMDGLSITSPSSTNNNDTPKNDEAAHNMTSNNARNKNKQIWYNVMRDDTWFPLLVGTYSSDDDNDDNNMISVPYDILYPINNNEEEKEEIQVQPLRKLLSKLPYAIRFMLELHIFDNNIIEIQQVRPPNPNESNESEWDAHKEEIAMVARRMVVMFIQHVVPPLLDMDWNGLDVDNFTLSELFAEAIGSKHVGTEQCKLSTVKQAIKDYDSMKKCSSISLFDQDDINNAMNQAKIWLRNAIELCHGSEQDLGITGDDDWRTTTNIDIIKKRSLWPYAEYSCKFLVNGDLVPADYVMVNNDCQQKPSSSFTSFGSNSRRGLREGGWFVRDRFCRVTNSFDVNESLVDWIRSQPMLCGREFKLLFDKGVGSDMKVWCVRMKDLILHVHVILLCTSKSLIMHFPFCLALQALFRSFTRNEP